MSAAGVGRTVGGLARSRPSGPVADRDGAPLLPSARAKRTERIIGIGAVVAVAATVWLGLWVTPPDQTQGDLVRLVYLHPAVAWVACTSPSGWPRW
jgi:hypothetical protein